MVMYGTNQQMGQHDASFRLVSLYVKLRYSTVSKKRTCLIVFFLNSVLDLSIDGGGTDCPSRFGVTFGMINLCRM